MGRTYVFVEEAESDRHQEALRCLEDGLQEVKKHLRCLAVVGKVDRDEVDHKLVAEDGHQHQRCLHTLQNVTPVLVLVAKDEFADDHSDEVEI